VDAGSREENASKEKSRALVLIDQNQCSGAWHPCPVDALAASAAGGPPRRIESVHESVRDRTETSGKNPLRIVFARLQRAAATTTGDLIVSIERLQCAAGLCDAA